MDVDTLPDLFRYKTLLVDVAKELWRRNHPDRKNLPKNFEDSLNLKFFEVQNNCATIPLVRELSHDDRENLFVEDELDDAVVLVADTIEAAGLDHPLPEAFPKHLLAQLQDYGKCLREDEWIEHRTTRRPAPVRYDSRVRHHLSRWVESSYEDAVDVIGEVTMARIGKPRMALLLAPDHEVEAPFAPADEETITTALKKHSEVRLHVVGRGLFAVDGTLLRILTVETTRILAGGQVPFVAEAKPIWEEFAEALANVPDVELAKLPTDGAERLDAYFYGGAESRP